MKFTNPAPRVPAPRDCAEVAPQLTALFDGEANDAQTREARAHLLSCPACSRQWLDWTRYRATFQSEPAPIVPPTLLWRVLIAYRIAAFARPARRRSRLPQVSAVPLRGIEAPLPPRLSAHILARTTRKPSAHVMLTPLRGAPVAAKSRFKGRDFSFGRAPLWAAPALALCLLILSRADFNASLPVTAPDSTVVRAPAVPTPARNDSAPEISIITPIPVASSTANLAIAPAVSVPAPIAATSPPLARHNSRARREQAVALAVASPAPTAPMRVVALASRAGRGAPMGAKVRAEARSQNGLSRAFALALNAGRSDLSRARTAPPANFNRAPIAPAVVTIAAPQTRVERSPARAARNVVAPTRFVRVVPADVAGSRVTLAALASPISPIRTLSSARLRTAAFSDDSMRPRAAHPRVAGRRLARLMPDEDETRLRVSRPIVQAPTLREASFGSADNGPKLDELRSAIDDFRASVAGNE